MFFNFHKYKHFRKNKTPPFETIINLFDIQTGNARSQLLAFEHEVFLKKKAAKRQMIQKEIILNNKNGF